MHLVREAGMFVLAALAVYLLISLASYKPVDPGFSHSGVTADIENAGGRLGAWIADVVFTLFGYVGYTLPLAAGFGAWRVYRERDDDGSPRDGRYRMLWWSGLIVALLGAAGLAHLHLSSGMPFESGGIVGKWIGAGFASAASFTGATLFLLAMFLGGVTIFTGLSWLRLMDRVGRGSVALAGRAAPVAADLGNRVAERLMKAAEPALETAPRVEPRLDSQARPPREPERPPVIQRAMAAMRPAPKKESPPERKERESAVAVLDVPPGTLPPLQLLDAPDERKVTYSDDVLENMSRLLESKLRDFNIDVKVVGVHPGPVITRFEVDPAPGIKASQITNLQRDLARSLSVISLRVVENIPGKSVVGIEVPNENREIVRLTEILSSKPYKDLHSPLALALGKDIGGHPIVADLGRMPHLMIAGTTGSGKSVCINALILSLVYKATPEHIRLIMVDPKMLELAAYEGIPHLLAPVVTDMKQAANALRWGIVEMERRYRLMAKLGVRNLAGFNQKIRDANEAGKPILDPMWNPLTGGEAAPLERMPHIVIVIDELADLMMVVGKKVEELIARLAQKARAAGIHLILATQRPSVDVITGLIKANIPTRIAFQVSARVDSRTVLDQMGAEQLLGHGDMLFLQPGSGLPMRVHGAFVADHEVHKVVDFLKRSGRPDYDERILSGETDAMPGLEAADADGDGMADGEADELYDEALKIVTESRRASISGVQRRLRIGYNRAARLIEEMERAGVVGPLQSNGSREVIAPPPPPRP